MDFSRSDFPQDFQFGVAGSSYQIEGHGFGGAGPTHWDSFAATPGNVVGGQGGRVACDHYHRYEDDLDLAAAAGFDAWRFSTSWARVIPDGCGAVNSEGLDFYDRLVDAVLVRGMEPWATLYHWELPSALADRGGWANRDTAHWFAEFGGVIMKRIGDRVASIAPVNEPWCVSWLSHFDGHHAPGLRDIRATARTMHHILLGHGLAIGTLRALGLSNLGCVVNFEYPQPADASPDSREKSILYDEIYNRWFLGAVRGEGYPMRALQALQPYLPEGWETDFPVIESPIDWIGINYYTRKLIAQADGSAGPSFPGFREVAGSLPKSEMGWEIYPEGLLHFLRRTHRDHADGLPIYVTENGIAAQDRLSGQPESVDDRIRCRYLDNHIAQIHTALEEGIDVRGYFIWSFLDNFEWSLGYDKRFGIVHVDFDTLKRTPKASYWALREALAR
ncbi:MAG: GH1 family beta-glucosidase [Paracoccaceae bacterium]|nr:GH1 family beta-glucosidase [Paracoccaceae bacterium]MDE2913932.1 GH1 family beta-glucosidase [Paracoccaceae bacterium]